MYLYSITELIEKGDYMDVGGRIKKFRAEKGMSTYALSEKTKISQSTLSKLENGKRKINLDILEKIASALEISVDRLAGESASCIIEDRLEELDVTKIELSEKSKVPLKFIENLDTVVPDFEIDGGEQCYSYISSIAWVLEIPASKLRLAFARQEIPAYDGPAAAAEKDFKDIIDHAAPKETEKSSIKSDPNYMGEYEPEYLKKIPIFGAIAAGLPIYADEQIEGYTFTDLNSGADYFGLRVKGDSMNAARICDEDIIIVRKQSCVENGQIAVVLVDGENATVKKFYRDGNRVTLVPASTNSEHMPQFYNLEETEIKILGKVVKNEISF